jgi:signal transduction histidine kinase
MLNYWWLKPCPTKDSGRDPLCYHQGMAEPKKRTEVITIFRYFTGIAMVYFASLSLVTAIQTGQAVNLSQIQSYLNLAINGVLFGYLSWTWLEGKLGKSYLPIALIAATIVPLFSNLIYLASPQESAQLTITRSWLLFPILIVPLVLIAWQYRFRVVLGFIILTTAIELGILVTRIGAINFETLPIIGVPLIRAFAFGTVGHIVARLIATQREQREKLLDANRQLSEHASTLEQLATSRERNRLARELHDTLAHTLSGLTVNLEAIKILLGSDHPQIEERIDHALRNTRTGLTDTRRALKDLRVKQLEDLGLKLSLENLAASISDRGDSDILVVLPDSNPDLPEQIEQVYYRIAQESLENIARHANAEQIKLSLKHANQKLVLTIKDDGVGFDLPSVEDQGLGIKGMQERARQIDAILIINSQPGQGTIVTLTTELSHV